MSNFMPGGYEDEDDSDIDDLVYGDQSKIKKRTLFDILQENKQVSAAMVTSNGSNGNSINSNGTGEFIELSKENIVDDYPVIKKEPVQSEPVQKKAFIWPNSPPEFKQGEDDASVLSQVIVLDDIRMAVVNGNLDYIKSQIELENEFEIDTILKSGWTSLMYAANSGQPEIVRYCLEKSADPNWHKGKNGAFEFGFSLIAYLY